MNLFNLQEQKNEHLERAKSMLVFANQVSGEIKRLYDMAKEMMWNIPGYKMEDAQKILDELDNLIPATATSPPGALQLFKYHAALGTFLASAGMIDPSEIKSPVEYKLEGTRIVLTGSKYPTEQNGVE